MHKYLKWVLKITLGLVSAFILMAIVLVMVVDPNDYKQEITDLVKAKTGYSVNIRGNIELSVFPWIGVVVNDVELENPAGFKGKLMGRVARVDVKAKLFALLGSRLEISTVTVRGLELNLRRNRNGRANWDGFIKRSQNPVVSKPEKSSGNIDLDISGIVINSSSLHFVDVRANKEHHLNSINLETGNIGAGRLQTLAMSFKYRSNKSKKFIEVRYTSKMSLNSNNGTLNLSGIKFALGTAVVTGYLKGKSVNGAKIYSGKLKSNNINLRSLLPQLGMSVPVTKDKSALKIFSFDVQLKTRNNLIGISNIKVKLDESNLTGVLSLRLGRKIPSFTFKLLLDRINLDRYLPPPPSKANRRFATSVTTKVFPVKLMRGLKGNGVLNISQMKVVGLDSKGVRLRLIAKRSKIDLIASANNFYGGKYTGHTVINVRGRTPSLRISEALRKVKGEAVYIILKPYLNYGGYLNNMTGTASMTAKFNTRGNSVDALRRQVNGVVWFDVSNGKLEGINVIKTLCNFYNQNKNRSQISNGINNTGFEKISGKFVLTKGKFRNDDFLMKANRGLLRITGKGAGDIVRDAVNYRLGSELVHSACDVNNSGTPSASERKTSFYVNVKGRLSNPSVRPDFKATIKANVKQKLLRKLNKGGSKNEMLRNLLRL